MYVPGEDHPDPLRCHLRSCLWLSTVVPFKSIQMLVVIHIFKNIHNGGIWLQGIEVYVLLMVEITTLTVISIYL